MTNPPDTARDVSLPADIARAPPLPPACEAAADTSISNCPTLPIEADALDVQIKSAQRKYIT